MTPGSRLRRTVWFVAIAGVVFASAATMVLLAPNEQAVCARIVARGPAESQERDTVVCEELYARRRARVGPFAYAREAWCMRFARGVDEMAECS